MKIFTDAQALINDKSKDSKLLLSDQKEVTITLPVEQALSILSPDTEFTKGEPLPEDKTSFIFKLFGIVSGNDGVTIVTSDASVLENIETFNENAKANKLPTITVQKTGNLESVSSEQTVKKTVKKPEARKAEEVKAETDKKTVNAGSEEVLVEEKKAKRGRPRKTEAPLVDKGEADVEKTEKFDNETMDFIQDKLSKSRNPILRAWVNRSEKIEWLKNVFENTRPGKGERSSILVGLSCQLDQDSASQVVDEVYTIYKSLG